MKVVVQSFHIQSKVVPKTNRMLVFPPMWTYLHVDRKVSGNTPKYTMGSYLHYVRISKKYTFVENKEKLVALV